MNLLKPILLATREICLESYLFWTENIFEMKKSSMLKKVLVLPFPDSSVGYVSDGNGNCIPISVTTECVEWYASDGNGDCLLIPTTEGPAPQSTHTAQTEAISAVTSN